MEKYNPKQDYYFVDFTLWEKGDPEYIKERKEKGEYTSEKGHPRWVRQPFQTEQEVQETMNWVFCSYPDRITELRVRSETELNEMILIDGKTGKILYKGDKNFEKVKGKKITTIRKRMTQREYDFGSPYQFNYDHETGVVDDEGLPTTKDIPVGLNQISVKKFKEKETYGKIQI